MSYKSREQQAEHYSTFHGNIPVNPPVMFNLLLKWFHSLQVLGKLVAPEKASRFPGCTHQFFPCRRVFVGYNNRHP
jgi:hypothetical protein